MTGKQFQAFKSNAKYPTPEAAALELLRIYKARLAEGALHAYTGVTNLEFLQGGGTVDEYRAGFAHGIAKKMFNVDEGGARITLPSDAA
jgi:hypothetical protein